jgi:dolichyl-phosphate-mannose--protein O-mannosyl transferase
MLIKKNYLSALFLIILSTVSNIPALTQTSYMLLPQSEDGFWSKIAQLPIAAFEVGFIEIAQLAVLDRVLLFVIVVSIYFALTNRQKDSSMYFLAVFLSVWALGAVNGTLGVNFRYQLPVLIFCAWVLLDNLPRPLLISDIHVKRKEAQN